jgi:putative serine protease PepD
MGWTPRHLWTGEWREESERAREAAAEAASQRLPASARTAPATNTDAPEADEEREPSRRAPLLLGLALAAIVLAGIAFAAGSLLNGGSGGNGGNGPQPLPAVASTPIKPHKGQTQAGAIYAAASPAVVSIRTNVGEGTGFLISDNGLFVTNDHVVGNSSHVLVRFGANGTMLDGDVLGTDPSSDLAVVSIDPKLIPKGTKPLQFADSRAVQVGDTAIAIGSPFGLDRTATEGIVSGLARSIQSPNGFSIDKVIQTDAPINPGNSGGPLLDDAGHVIGVNSQIATAGVPGNIGIGFAIPSNTVRQVVPLLERGKAVRHPWLGVRNAPTSLTNPNGARVVEVIPRSPSERAGLRSGDVITRVAGQPVQSPEDVAAAITARKPGDTVDVVVKRSGATVTLHVKLGTQPTRTP